MAEVVEMDVVLGHQAQVIRSNGEGSRHTHDWKVYVKQIQGLSLRKFVKKVVFHLDENYRQRKRVIRKAPYEVNESGNKSFVIKIDIYFRKCEAPKFVTFEYDLFLSAGRPLLTTSRIDRLTFVNPDEHFKKRLLEAGGVLKHPDSAISKRPNTALEKQFLSLQKVKKKKTAPKVDEKEGVPPTSNGSRKRNGSELDSIRTKKRSLSAERNNNIRLQNERHSFVESSQKKNITGRHTAVNRGANVAEEKATASLGDISVDSLDCESILDSILGGFVGVMPLSPLKM